MKDATIALLGKAKQNLEAVKILRDRGFYHVAITRSYYVMFYVMDAILQENDLLFTSHEERIEAFEKYFVLTNHVKKYFQEYLLESLAYRYQADYAPLWQAEKTVVDKQIERAEEFVELGNKFDFSNL
ncbi:MAG: HEPN domain-containing protein [Trichodesmium sp.]